jgi:hypothetical protein
MFGKGYWLGVWMAVVLFPAVALADQLPLGPAAIEPIEAVGELEDMAGELSPLEKKDFLSELQPLLRYLNHSTEIHDQRWLVLLERRRIRRELDLLSFHSGLYGHGQTERYVQMRDRLEGNRDRVVAEMSELMEAGGRIEPASPAEISAIHHRQNSRRGWRVATERLVGELEDQFVTAWLPERERQAWLRELMPLLNALK